MKTKIKYRVILAESTPFWQDLEALIRQKKLTESLERLEGIGILGDFALLLISSLNQSLGVEK